MQTRSFCHGFFLCMLATIANSSCRHAVSAMASFSVCLQLSQIVYADTQFQPWLLSLYACNYRKWFMQTRYDTVPHTSFYTTATHKLACKQAQTYATQLKLVFRNYRVIYADVCINYLRLDCSQYREVRSGRWERVCMNYLRFICSQYREVRSGRWESLHELFAIYMQSKRRSKKWQVGESA